MSLNVSLSLFLCSYLSLLVSAAASLCVLSAYLTLCFLSPSPCIAACVLPSVSRCRFLLRYLEWQVVEGTFVYQYQKAGYFSSAKYIHKVASCCAAAIAASMHAARRVKDVLFLLLPFPSLFAAACISACCGLLFLVGSCNRDRGLDVSFNAAAGEESMPVFLCLLRPVGGRQARHLEGIRPPETLDGTGVKTT